MGDFFLNEENTLQFTPSERENFNPASFGLSSFVSPAISREIVAEVVEKETVALYSEKKKTAYPFMKYAAIGIIAITLGGFTGLKIYEGEVEKYNFAEKQKADTRVENQIQEATFIIDDALPALNISITRQAGKYHIVAGAFRIEANAKRKMKQLLQKGFSPISIGTNRYGLHQIVYSSHENRLEALKTLRIIKRTENQDAWLLVQDLNK